MNVMSANPISHQAVFTDAALQHWAQLGQELRHAVELFNQGGGAASFVQAGATEYRVSNSDTGLEVRMVADAEDHLAHYEFVRTNENSAGAPEGGITLHATGTKWR